ncbi:hypothetical protein ACODT3_41260, partial [Streptomyces sp. 4.24]
GKCDTHCPGGHGTYYDVLDRFVAGKEREAEAAQADLGLYAEAARIAELALPEAEARVRAAAAAGHPRALKNAQEGLRRARAAVRTSLEAAEDAGRRLETARALQRVDAAEAELVRQAGDHLKAGTGVDYDETAGITDPKRLAAYFAKHGAFSAKRYQDNMPEQWREAAGAEDEDGNVAGTGRVWGYKGMKKVEVPIQVTAREAVRLGRILRGYCRSMDSVALVEEETRTTDTRGRTRKVKTGRKVLIPRSSTYTTSGKSRKKTVGENGRPVTYEGKPVFHAVATSGAGANRRRAARLAGHAAPRTVTTPVARYEGGRIYLSGDWATGFTSTQYADPDQPFTMRKVQRRTARFSQSGKPSGWALIHDGERIGSLLAGALGQTLRVELGLRDGLRAAGLPVPPRVPATANSGTLDRDRLTELRARYGPARPGRTAALPDVTGLELLDDTTEPSTLPGTTAKLSCVDCGLPLDNRLAPRGIHFGCTPDPLLDRNLHPLVPLQNPRPRTHQLHLDPEPTH